MAVEPEPKRDVCLRLDLDASQRRIENFGELIDALAELDIDLDDEISAIDLNFPLHFELEIYKTDLGLRIIGF